MAKWYTALSSPHRRSWVQAPHPDHPDQCLWTHLQICGSKRLCYHSDLCTVSRCHTRGESEDHLSEKACKRDPSWLWNPGQTSLEVQNRSISGSTKWTYVLPKNKKTSKDPGGWLCSKSKDELSFFKIFIQDIQDNSLQPCDWPIAATLRLIHNER